MYIFQVPTSFSFEILSFSFWDCQQQIILISHDNKNCFDIFFSLQKLEALDFITMLSQWSSFSSQKVQIRFFLHRVSISRRYLYRLSFIQPESESLTQSRLLLPQGTNVVLMQLSFAYFRDYGGLDTRKCQQKET